MAPDAMPVDLTAPRLAELVDPASICRGEEIRARAAEYPVYRMGYQWLAEFIMQPHPQLRRPGSVCPFVAQSMGADAMIFAVRPGAQGDGRAAFDIMAPIAHAFRGLAPVTGPGVALKALTVFFPDLPARDWTAFIDGGHRLLKPWMVERGLMLGEFHPHSTVPGATNPDLHVMRAPVPAFLIREMAMHDTKFINNINEEPARRAVYLRAYLRHVGPTVPRKVRENAERMLAAVLQEIEAGAAA